MLLAFLPKLLPRDPLLSRLQQGDREAVLEVYERYFAPLYQYVRFKLGDPTVAEDVVSDVFVALIESLGTTSAPRRHLRGWLFQVARNKLYQHLSDVPHVSLEEWMPASSDSSPDQGDVFEMQRVRHALNMLTPDHQEVLTLRFAQQLSLQETAELMGKSVSAIKSLQFRAVDTLRQLLKTEAANG